jgi:hypothetical protein
VMASVGPRDAVGPHANNSMQNGSNHGKTGVFTTWHLRPEALPTRGVVRQLRSPLRVAQSGIHHGLLPRSGNRRRRKARRRDRFDKLRFVRNGFAAQRRRICLASLIPRAPHQYLREATRKQTGDEIRWVELAACYRPCAHSLDKSSVAQSWTEASRGDRISPRHVIVQLRDKCNGSFLRSRAGIGIPPVASFARWAGVAARRANHFGFTETVSSPKIKNISLFQKGETVAYLSPSRPGKRGVGHRHERGTGSGGRGSCD